MTYGQLSTVKLSVSYSLPVTHPPTRIAAVADELFLIRGTAPPPLARSPSPPIGIFLFAGLGADAPSRGSESIRSAYNFRLKNPFLHKPIVVLTSIRTPFFMEGLLCETPDAHPPRPATRNQCPGFTSPLDSPSYEQQKSHAIC